jgi:hypothetical protein
VVVEDVVLVEGEPPHPASARDPATASVNALVRARVPTDQNLRPRTSRCSHRPRFLVVGLPGFEPGTS